MWPKYKTRTFVFGLLLPMYSHAVEYDLKGLASRGIDPSIVEQLERKDVFPSGENVVDISVNGEFRGSFNVNFDREGALCFTHKLLIELGMNLPDSVRNTFADAGTDNLCGIERRDPSNFTIIYNPDKLDISIVVTHQYLASDDKKIEGKSGGVAALINYDFFSSRNTNLSGKHRYSYLSLGSGINIDNWIIRGKQQFQSTDEGLKSDTLSAYTQRYIPAIDKIFQAGDIDVATGLFEVSSISGVQLMPEEALNAQGENGASITGIANTHQARVEVRQFGMLIFTTLVPAGTFNLPNIPVKNANADLDVTVVETDGQTQHFIVPASSINRPMVSKASGYSLALGRISNPTEKGDSPKLLTLSNQWAIASGLSVQAGLLASDKYRSIATNINAVPFRSTGLSARMVLSNDDTQHLKGAQAGLTASYVTENNVSLSVAVVKNTPNFRTLLESAFSGEVNNKQDTQMSVSLAWTPWKLGTFSLGHSKTTQYGLAGSYSYNMLRWIRRFDKVTVSMSGSNGSGYGGKKNKQVNINLSFPLGKNNLNSYYRSSNDNGRVGSQFAGSMNDEISYRLSTERNFSSSNNTMLGGVNANLHYTTVGASISKDNQQSSSYSVSTQGGAVLHQNGVTFSPNAIDETFGIIELNEKRAGVKIATPNGNVWTDFKGRAVVSSIPAYRHSYYDVDTKSLPKNIDIANGHRESTLARGTVDTIKYNIIINNQMLFKISLPDGKLLPKGSSLLDDNLNFLASVVDDGLVFLSNAPQNATMFAQNIVTKEQCKFSYFNTDKEEGNVLYKDMAVTCV